MLKKWNGTLANFFLMAVPAFAVNALLQYLFGKVDYELAIATAIILGAFWSLFTTSRVV